MQQLGGGDNDISRFEEFSQSYSDGFVCDLVHSSTMQYAPAFAAASTIKSAALGAQASENNPRPSVVQRTRLSLKLDVKPFVPKKATEASRSGIVIEKPKPASKLEIKFNKQPSIMQNSIG